MTSPETAEKRKAGDEPKEAIKKQKTIEESIENGNGKDDKKEDSSTTNVKSEDTNTLKDGQKNAFTEVKSDTDQVHASATKEQEAKSAEISKDNESVLVSEKREASIPSSILEKGIIYFFFRGRVGVKEPQGIEDVARSYIILRPLPIGAKIASGPLEDSGDARMLALPKKMLPKSKRDRFLVFVEKKGAFIRDLREQFAGTEYSTKTRGTSDVPAATPFAEGIYAITSTGRESHLAYQITIPEPSSFGEVQKELGVNTKGSFICSVKNPTAPGPANAQIDNPAEYPEKTMKKFRGLRWMPLKPELLDYEGTQMLIIGEGMRDLAKATEEQKKDAKDESKEKPDEEMDKLEEEDDDRVEHLKEDDPVFADLGLSSTEYSHMQTTW